MTVTTVTDIAPSRARPRIEVLGGREAAIRLTEAAAHGFASATLTGST